MHSRSKIRVYNFSSTKSLLWPTVGQREDADCWYFCLFKLFTPSETTLILVCGMLAVGACGAVWRTHGLSKTCSRKHAARCDGTVSFLLSTALCVTDHRRGETADVCFKLLGFLYLRWIRGSTVIIGENDKDTNQWIRGGESEPHSHTWEFVPTSVLK